MPNKNYLRGVRFERELMKRFKPENGFVIRASGSHGPYDIIIVDLKHGFVEFIQCKTKLTDDPELIGCDKEEEMKPVRRDMVVSFVKITKHVRTHLRKSKV